MYSVIACVLIWMFNTIDIAVEIRRTKRFPSKAFWFLYGACTMCAVISISAALILN